MGLTQVLVACMLLVMIGMYIVSAKAARETFGEDSDGENAETSSSDGVSKEDVDGTVFRAYMDVHGVPPAPLYATHYARVASTESLDEAQLRRRIADDRDKVSEPAKPPKVAEQPKREKPESDEAAEADLQALREKAASLATMSGPIGGSAETFVTKLRSIAGQASDMVRDLERRRNVPDEPKGIECFISF
jgi:hypothetical protein